MISLILHFFDDIQSKYPDGIVWVNLENSIVDPLNQIAKQMDIPIPSGTEQPDRWLVLQEISNKRIFWVLDGGQTIDALQNWLNFIQHSNGFYLIAMQEKPDPGWLLSRKFKGFQMPYMEREESRALTEKVLGVPLKEEEVSDWDAVIEWVGHHPLSVRILAGVASFGHPSDNYRSDRWKSILHELNRFGTNAIYIGLMQGAGDKGRSLNASLSLIYERILAQRPAAIEGFRALGIFAIKRLHPEIIRKVLGKEETVVPLLNILVQSGVLDLDTDNLYTIPPIVQAFAKTLLSQNYEEFLAIKANYVATFQHLSAVETVVQPNQNTKWLWADYLHAMEIAWESELLKELFELINNTYHSAILLGQALPFLQRAEKLLTVMLANQKDCQNAIPFLHKIVGDLLLTQRQPEKARFHFSETLINQNIPLLLRIQTHLQRANCAFVLDNLDQAVCDLQLAATLIQSNSKRLSYDIFESYEFTYQLLYPDTFHDDETRSDTSAHAKRLQQAAYLANIGRFEFALLLLEIILKTLPKEPLLILHFEIWLLQAEVYISLGEFIRTKEILATVEGEKTKFINFEGLPGISERYWRLKWICEQTGDAG